MGGIFSRADDAKPPPSIVLVPPCFESRERGRSRFTKSAYDVHFSQPGLRYLFGDYLMPSSNAALRFSPVEDERVSVVAKLGVPSPGISLIPLRYHPPASQDNLFPGNEPTGSIALRYEPDPVIPFKFIDLKACVGSRNKTSAYVRGCYFSPSTNTAAFATLSLLQENAKYLGSPIEALKLGLRYTSENISVGCVVSPLQEMTLEQGWLVGRKGNISVGVQTNPSVPLRQFPAYIDLQRGDNLNGLLQFLRNNVSFAVGYQAGDPTKQKGAFSAVVQSDHTGELSISFLHHMAIQRNVRNIFEKRDVVGITNYVDVGFELRSRRDSKVSLAIPVDVDQPSPSDKTDRKPVASSEIYNMVRLAASWQINKNILVKGRLGMDSLALAGVVKGWWQPSFAVGAAIEKKWGGGPIRFGLTLSVETFRNLRYERSSKQFKTSGGRVTQRHVASTDDIALSEGQGLLVPLQDVDKPGILGQRNIQGGNFL